MEKVEELVYVGADGCPGGWVCVSMTGGGNWSVRLVATNAIATIATLATMVFIDIPIGLLDSECDQRACDREARGQLGRLRGSSVFPVPARASLRARDYQEALAINRRTTGRGISKQSWLIAPRIRVVDELLQADPGLRGVLRESHPEVCFWALNGAKPMCHSKKTRPGRDERIEVLRRFFPAAGTVYEQAMARYRRRQVAPDDIIDALVLAVSARMGAGHYRTLPANPPRDAVDLPMEMAYWVP
ncbi:MAG: DUF429 domain-containing protein [Burkholderiales bacterium]|jgi:predicted RNase H-like nuclease